MDDLSQKWSLLEESVNMKIIYPRLQRYRV